MMTESARSASVSSESSLIDASYSVTTAISGEQEYETQFLGFCPKSFCDGLYNAVQDYAWEFFLASQQYIKSEVGNLMSDEELHKASQVFLNTVSQQIDRAFDKFEAFALTNVLNIPANVILPEDAVQQEYSHMSDDDHQLLKDEIHTLKERIIAAKYVNASLRQEFEQLRSTQEQYSQFLEQLRAMDKTIKGNGVHDVHESLKYTLEKSNKVLAMLNDMECAASSKSSLPHVDVLQHIRNRNSQTNSKQEPDQPDVPSND